MNKKLNDAVIKKIIEHIPPHLNPAGYLTDTLRISKESAYRRLRGEIPFNMEEIFMLSQELNFSLDNFYLPQKSNHALFHFAGNIEKSTKNTFVEYLIYYLRYIEMNIKAKNVELIIAQNSILFAYYHNFNSLLKFYYYKWSHTMEGTLLKHDYSDIMIPQEVEELYNKVVNEAQHLKYGSFILDKDFFLNTVNDVQYYYLRGFIDDSEVFFIKNDLINYLDWIEAMAQKEIHNNNLMPEIYLSLLTVESNISYWNCDGNEVSVFWIYSVYPLSSEDKTICHINKTRLLSLKKNSILISGSNQTFQSEFFNKQREYINNIGNPFF